MPKICLRDNRFWCLLLIVLTMLMELSGAAAAQQFGFPGGGRRPRSSEYQDRQEYNTQTVTTVKGQVESLGSYGMTGWRIAPGMQSQGLLLKTDKGNISVQLGPPWYVRKQVFDLKQGDSLKVTGSQVTKDGQTLLLAAQVKKDGQTLKVRDEQGVPLWQGEDHGGRGAGGRGEGGMGSGGRSPGGGGQSNW
jgi:hypothetical protein